LLENRQRGARHETEISPAIFLLCSCYPAVAQQTEPNHNAGSRGGISMDAPGRSSSIPTKPVTTMIATHRLPMAAWTPTDNPSPRTNSWSMISAYPWLLQVPTDWNTRRSELLFYEGNIWSKRDFDYQRRPGQRDPLSDPEIVDALQRCPAAAANDGTAVAANQRVGDGTVALGAIELGVGFLLRIVHT
jgi:hypothetical protein